MTADITLQSSEFATTPADSDTLQNAKWTIKKQGEAAVEVDAGAVTSFKPPVGTFEPNSTYTVTVTYEGGVLADSPVSESVTFTTGATRNIFEHQRAQIQTLITRLAALEADHTTLMNNNNSGY